MCRLLGISVNRPTNIRLSFKDFEVLSRIHSDGHGFAYEEDGHLVAIRDAEALFATPSGPDVLSVNSRTFLGHLRMASHGGVALQNTHPFLKTLGDTEFAFAHNGTVSRVKDWEISQQCSGQTDSEHAFQWALDQVRGVPPENFAATLQSAAHRIRTLGRFNFVLTDGQAIWAYADDSLWILERDGAYEGRVASLKKARLTVNLQDYKASGERAVLVASEPLTNESWRQLPAGTLVVLRDGNIVDELPANRLPAAQPTSAKRSYRSLQELEASEQTQSWSKIATPRESEWLIAAIHGGRIERFTERIAEAIAGSQHSLYCFLGLRDRSRELHIPSHLFKCPQFQSLQRLSRFTPSIHGQRDEVAQCIYIGGANTQRAQMFAKALSEAGFEIKTTPPELAGLDPNNFVNRTAEQGVQLEISMGLRRTFFDESGDSTELFARFVETIRLVINRLSQAA